MPVKWRGFALLLLIFMTSTLLAADRLRPADATAHVRGTRTVTFADGQRATLAGVFHRLTGAPVQVSGGFEGERLAASGREALLRFIGEHPAQFRIPAEDLDVVTSGQVRHKSYLTARQTIDGRPVLGTQVLLRVHRSGRVLSWGADVVDGSGWRWDAAIPADAAANALKFALDCPAADVVRTTEVWFRDGAELRPAYGVQLGQRRDLRQGSGLVDGQTGEVLASEDGIRNATLSGTLQGEVLPFTPNSTPEVWPLANATVRLDTPATAVLTDSAGGFEMPGLTPGDYAAHVWLEGPYVSMQNVQIDIASFDITPNPFRCDSLCTAPDTVLFLLDPGRDSVTLGALNTWVHVCRTRDWWAGMDPALDIVNQTIYIFPDQADPNLATNAGFIAPWPPFIPVPLIVFGAGDAEFHNFGYCADVVYHEYSHAVTHQFYPGDPESGFTQMEAAMHEGFSDYFACILTQNPQLGQGMYIEYPDSAFRSLENDLLFPDDWVGEGHWDGQILSGAMWEARAALGAAVVDTIFHYARYGSPPDLDAYYQEVLIEDDDDDDLLNGTPHELELWTAFHRHGIGPDSIHIPDAVEPPAAALPLTPRLVSLYPNPFNPTTTVHFELPQAAAVTFTVHDVLGREVQRVTLDHQSAGAHSLALDLGREASGVYFIGLHSGNRVQTAKAVLMK